MNALLQVTDLIAVGNEQPVDTDYLLTRISQGALLLLNQKPQTYPEENHKTEERIIVLRGRVGIQVSSQKVYAEAGQMITVAPNCSHSYTDDSDGIVAVVFGAE
jgi:mannose-6-phosphate isomerase-like protein (cupin superfamily)